MSRHQTHPEGEFNNKDQKEDIFVGRLKMSFFFMPSNETSSSSRECVRNALMNLKKDYVVTQTSWVTFSSGIAEIELTQWENDSLEKLWDSNHNIMHGSKKDNVRLTDREK